MTPAAAAIRTPRSLRSDFDRLDAIKRHMIEERTLKKAILDDLSTRIELAPHVESALKKLSDSMFADIVRVIADKLSIALQEVLGQPLRLIAEASYKRNAASIEFHIERDGQAEDILRGQGGSVANVLSVGLRLFALATLDEKEHRRFLVLDEQDCWLRPDLVPMLVKIVRDACTALGFQVLMISHHDHRIFEEYAERIYRLVPQADGSVKVELLLDAVPTESTSEPKNLGPQLKLF